MDMMDKEKAYRELRKIVNKHYANKRQELEEKHARSLDDLEEERKSFNKYFLEKAEKRLSKDYDFISQDLLTTADTLLRESGLVQIMNSGKMGPPEGLGIFCDEWTDDVPLYHYYLTEKGKQLMKYLYGGKEDVGNG
jgi:hypothetical protein